MSQETNTAREIQVRLSAPFQVSEVKFKPQMVKGNRALTICYIDARVVEDRLDSVVGMENWQDNYDICQDGSVVCRLAVRVDGEWITKTDVGSMSEQPDGGDRLKSAFSDSLKRAAVKFGIGRYIYRIPNQWCEYDPAKKQITQLPQLPAFAIPGGRAEPPGKKPAGQPQPAQQPQPTTLPMPANGRELFKRLTDFDGKVAKAGRCKLGALVAHVADLGRAAGYPDVMAEWEGNEIKFAVDTAKKFVDALPAGQTA